MKIIAQMGNSAFIVSEKNKLYNIQMGVKHRIIANIPNTESWMKSGYWEEPHPTEKQNSQIKMLLQSMN